MYHHCEHMPPSKGLWPFGVGTIVCPHLGIGVWGGDYSHYSVCPHGCQILCSSSSTIWRGSERVELGNLGGEGLGSLGDDFIFQSLVQRSPAEVAWEGVVSTFLPQNPLFILKGKGPLVK